MLPSWTRAQLNSWPSPEHNLRTRVGAYAIWTSSEIETVLALYISQWRIYKRMTYICCHCWYINIWTLTKEQKKRNLNQNIMVFVRGNASENVCVVHFALVSLCWNLPETWRVSCPEWCWRDLELPYQRPWRNPRWRGTLDNSCPPEHNAYCGIGSQRSTEVEMIKVRYI